MSEFVLPNKKNVTFSREASVAESGSGGDFSFSSTPPEVFGTGVIGDAATLENILENVDIRFVASTAGYSSGDVVQTWQNSGKESGKDLSHPSKLGNRSDVDKPAFNIGETNNPFTTGAIKFVADTTADGHESKFLHFGGVAEDGSNGERLTISGEFTMYTVMSFDKAAPKTRMSPLWTYGISTRNNTNPVLGATLSVSVSLLGDNQITGDSDEIFRGNSLVTTGATKMTTANGDPVILVISRDSDGNFSIYDFNAFGFVNEKKGIGQVFESNNNDVHIDSFGPKCQIRDTTITTLGVASDPGGTVDISDGDTVYLAEWGLFRTSIGGQQSAALGRLLKEKYQIS